MKAVNRQGTDHVYGLKSLIHICHNTLNLRLPFERDEKCDFLPPSTGNWAMSDIQFLRTSAVKSAVFGEIIHMTSKTIFFHTLLTRWIYETNGETDPRKWNEEARKRLPKEEKAIETIYKAFVICIV